MINDRSIPAHTREALINYFDRGWEPGSFLMAVLRNDLMRASFSADHINQSELPKIATWVYRNAPYGSWGNEEIVRGWLNNNEHRQEYAKRRFMEVLAADHSVN